MSGLPRWLIVVVVLGLAVLGIYYGKPPHHVCESQVDSFREAQAGQLYPRVVKQIPIQASIFRAIDSCKRSNGPGGCYDFFQILRSLIRDSKASSAECATYFGEEEIVRKTVSFALEFMVLSAWGEKTPEKGAARFGWLQSGDLLLFCELKDLFTQMYGEEEYEKLRVSIVSRLPAEAKVYKDGECINCSSRTAAATQMPLDEIWVRSLFSIRCEKLQ